MPVLLRVDELEAGMRLLQPVRRDDQTMLTAGKVLEEWEILSLRRRFPDLIVQVGDPVLDEWVEFQDDSHDREVAVTVHQKMGTLMNGVRQRLGTQTALEAKDISGLQSAITDVVRFMNENPVAAGLLIKCSDTGDYLSHHVGNVFYISLLVGNAIRDYIYNERQRSASGATLSARYALNLTPLALGCLFHDIGMIPIEHLYDQEGPLSEEDREQVRMHPVAGAEMLPKGFDAVARMTVRTHHENIDGTGYPEGISRDSLHIFSRIIRAADALDAGSSERVYARPKSQARLLWEMSCGPEKERFDPAVVKIMMGLIQPFPIGAKIRLGCGRYAVVVRHNRRAPFRPQVIVAFDEEGRKLKRNQLSPPIDLSKTEDVQLKSFGGEDLGFLGGLAETGVWGRSDQAQELAENSLVALLYP